MAKRKQEIQLQQEIETQEDWEEFLKKPGLLVADIYQEWCGPCRSIQSHLRKIKVESSDSDLINYAVVKSEKVESLRAYRGHCVPCFLMFAGGALVGVVRGANPPELTKQITKQVEHEKKVMSGEAQRQEFHDQVAEEAEMRFAGEKVRLDAEALEPETVQKEVTVAVLKPDLVASGRADEIIAKLAEENLVVIEKLEKVLTPEDVRLMYPAHVDKDYWKDLEDFMTSGPSIVLVISRPEGTGENVISEMHAKLGPPNVDEARTSAPQSLRALYGSERFVNGIHAADSKDAAARELAFFFPSFEAPQVPRPQLQRTLAIIRPKAYAQHKDAILAKIREAGLEVALEKEMVFTREQAESFYSEHREAPFFEALVDAMTSGPVLALALAGVDAIERWRRLLGPKTIEEAKQNEPDSLRAVFAVENEPLNQLHGSDSNEAASREIELVFPLEQTLAAIKPDAYEHREEIIQRAREAGFTLSASRDLVLSEDLARQFYAEQAEKPYFEDLVGHMCSGNTMFLVLERPEAVLAWRQLMGPAADPIVDRESNPNSVRAMFGTDVLRNAAHGSSNAAHAKRTIELIFGTTEFAPEAAERKRREQQASALESAPAPAPADASPEQMPAAVSAAPQDAAAPAAGEAAEPAATDEKPESQPQDAVREEAPAPLPETQPPPPEQQPEQPPPEQQPEQQPDKAPETSAPGEPANEGAPDQSAPATTDEKPAAAAAAAEQPVAEPAPPAAAEAPPAAASDSEAPQTEAQASPTEEQASPTEAQASPTEAQASPEAAAAAAPEQEPPTNDSPPSDSAAPAESTAPAAENAAPAEGAAPAADSNAAPPPAASNDVEAIELPK